MPALYVSPIPSDTSLAEDSRNFARSTTDFFDKHRAALTGTGIAVLTLFVNRAIMRRELKHINFAIDVYPGGSLIDEDDQSWGQ